MHLGKYGTSDMRTSSKHHWPLRDSDINSTWVRSEINGLAEFWLKLYACVNSVYQAFVFHTCKIRRPGDEAKELATIYMYVIKNSLRTPAHSISLSEYSF